MRFRIFTLGCKVNQYDSQLMREDLIHNGFEYVTGGSADVCIINTCTVTAESDKKNRQTLRRVRRDNPDAVIVLSGCMTQAAPDTADALVEADIVIGNSNRALIPELVKEFCEKHERIVRIEPHSAEYSENGQIASFSERTRAMIKIEDGCNNFCSYCMIPYARGRVRSRSIESIRAEVASLSPDFCEVVLVGINLSAYGRDIGLSLFDAVDAVCADEKIRRVRLGSIEPDLLSEETIERLSRQPKFCPQFHLALQSGCDETLKRMNRHYDTAFYRNIVKLIRQRFDNPSITTDIMVGFPGETEEEFAASLAFAKEIAFARAHVFAYSRRKGTRADKMPDQLLNADKERRSALMIKATEESATAFRQSQVGRICEFLPETHLGDGVYDGYSENYTSLRVKLREKTTQPVKVKITNACGEYCEAEVVG